MTPESQLKKNLKKILTDRGAYWSVVAGGSYSKPGDPDIIACYKGLFIAIEAKTYEGTQSEWQKLRERQVRDARGIYLVVKAPEHLTAYLDEIDRLDTETD